MSYGFRIVAASVAAATLAVAAKFDEVVESQPVHRNDRDAAVGAAKALVGLSAEPGEGQELEVKVSGWLQWRLGDGVMVPYEFTGANLSVQTGIISKTE